MTQSTLREFFRIPRQDKYVTGLDIGSRRVKIVKLRKARGKPAKVVARVCEEVAYGAEETLRNRQTEALRKALAQIRGSQGWVVAALPRDMISERTINLPAVDRAELDEMVRFDAERHIPFPLDSVEIAWRPIRERENHTSDVLLAAARNEDLETHLAILREAGIEPDFLLLNVAGSARVFGLQGFGSETIGVLEIGERRSDLSIFRGEQMVFSRAMRTGGARLQEASQKRLEQKHSGEVGVFVSDPARKWSFDPFRNLEGEPEGDWLEEFTAELKRTLQAYNHEVYGGSVDRLILCGGLAHAPGIEERIEDLTGIETLAAEDVIPDGVDPGKVGSLAPEMTTALGVALDVATPDGWPMNLLPHKIIERRRRRRQREFWKQCGTLFLMIAILLVGIGYARIRNLRNRIDIQASQMAQLEREVEEAKSLKEELDVLEALRDTEHSAYQVMETIYRRSFDDIQILDLHFTKQGEVVLECLAANDARGSAYIRTLADETSLFDPERPDFGRFRTVTEAGAQLRRFDFKLAIQRDEEEEPRATGRRGR